jgi:prepilin-type N-terminal cleavage/methylation domain-containing protein
MRITPPCRAHGPIGNPKSPHRRGYTLIELLVVIAIIAVLVGLLGAGAQAIRQRMREVSVRHDMTQLQTSIQKWKGTYEMPYMPSFIVLREDGLYGTHPTPAVAAMENQSIAVLKRIFPRLDTPQLAAARGNVPPFLGHDWNQDGVITSGNNGVFILEGDQCLVFFLGGAQINGTCMGFSTNKAYPMAMTGNRQSPIFEFPTPRLQLVAHPASTALSGTISPFLSFMDNGRDRPYLYFASRNGNDYTSDCPSSGQTDPVGPWTATGNPVVPYREAAVAKFYNRDGFQIICAGSDKQFGSPAVLAAFQVWDARTGAPYVNNSADPGRDDITNFHSVRLGSGQ